MFEALDDVPWASLEASCGRGEQVPRLLRKLIEVSPEEQESVAAVIEGVLTGQGEVYEATPYAVPFLLEIIESRHIASQHVYSIMWEIGNIRVVASQRSDFRLPEWSPMELTLAEACREAVRSGMDLYFRDADSATLACRRGAFELLAEFLVDDARVRARFPELAKREPDEDLRQEALELLNDYEEENSVDLGNHNRRDL